MLLYYPADCKGISPTASIPTEPTTIAVRILNTKSNVARIHVNLSMKSTVFAAPSIEFAPDPPKEASNQQDLD